MDSRHKKYAQRCRPLYHVTASPRDHCGGAGTGSWKTTTSPPQRQGARKIRSWAKCGRMLEGSTKAQR
jgi:hypothetical protein